MNSPLLLFILFIVLVTIALLDKQEKDSVITPSVWAILIGFVMTFLTILAIGLALTH